MTTPDKPTIEKLQPGDSDTQSADVVAGNIARLKALFPELVTEGKEGASVNIDVLKQLVGDATVTDCDEKFGLNWHGKRRARQLALTPSTGTLRPCPEESVDWDATQNLFIEGDNLEVLKLLQKSYAGRVKLIYIDPPYNTGNEFIYPDNFTDPTAAYLEYTGQVDASGLKLSANTESSGRFHTNWLNMMLARLRLAHGLLARDGVLAISIDDHEVHNLRHLCDEVFGPENFVANIVWQSRTSISNDQEVSLNHNHTLLYARSRDTLTFFGEPLKSDEYRNPDEDPRGPWKLVPIDANKPGGNTQYPIRNPKTGEEYMPPNGRSWAFNPEEYQRLFDDGRIKFGMTDDSAPKKKLFLREREARGDSKTPSSILLDAGTTKDGTSELMQLFDGKKVFDYPKPSTFMNRLLDYCCNRGGDNLVLDFFAGSCSMGHACLQWTAGRARFVMVQLPEPTDKDKPYAKEAAALGLKTIADIGKERLRRVIRSTDPSLYEVTSRADLGFRVFKLDSSNIREWEPSREDIAELLEAHVENLRTDRTEQDILYELLLKRGLDLCVPIETKEIAGKTVHSIGAGTLFACLSESITPDEGEPLALGILAWHQELDPAGDTTVVFRDSAFADDVVKTNVAAILDQSGLKNVRSL
tara:strand:- start:5783 stop:7708 length:1926 start_codon:yes stop_codon:yes gene_type:complete